jgi:hypothetical protein
LALLACRLAFFLSGDLAPQDLWNSKKIEKAAMLYPKVDDYLLVEFFY